MVNGNITTQPKQGKQIILRPITKYHLGLVLRIGNKSISNVNDFLEYENFLSRIDMVVEMPINKFMFFYLTQN